MLFTPFFRLIPEAGNTPERGRIWRPFAFGNACFFADGVLISRPRPGAFPEGERPGGRGAGFAP